MKKRDLKKLALLGLTTGMILSQDVQSNEMHDKIEISSLLAANTSTDTKPKGTDTTSNPNDSNLGYHLMTEEELLLELNTDGQRMYKQLDAHDKKMALEVASERCNNSNECKGLNACKTDKNECAGKGSCKGQGKCAIADKNLAVKLVYDKMQKKRSDANSGK